MEKETFDHIIPFSSFEYSINAAGILDTPIPYDPLPMAESFHYLDNQYEN